MTHTFLGLFLHRIKPLKGKYHQLFFFLAGNILPDLFSRVPMIVFPKQIPFFSPYHTLLGTLLLSYAAAHFFETARRKQVFLYLFSGSVFHLITDLVQKDIFNRGYRIFFPLTYKIDIGFIWPEDSVYALPFLAVIAFAVYRKTLFQKKH